MHTNRSCVEHDSFQKLTDPVVERPWRSYLVALINAIEIPLTAFGNMLICWVVYKYQELQTPANSLLVSLALADMLFIVTFATNIALEFGMEWMEYCDVFKIIFCIPYIMTLFHLSIISLDRLLALRNPLRYPIWITNKRAVITAIILWIVIFASLSTKFVFEVIKNDEQDNKFGELISQCQRSSSTCNHHQPRMGTLMIIRVTVTFLIPCIVMLISYCWIFKIARVHNKEVQVNMRASARRRQEMKAVKTIGIVVGSFLVFYTPFYVAVCVHTLKTERDYFHEAGKIIGPFAMFASFAAWINPFVYGFTNQHFKAAFRKTYRGIKRKFNCLNNQEGRKAQGPARSTAHDKKARKKTEQNSRKKRPEGNHLRISSDLSIGESASHRDDVNGADIIL